MEAASLVKIRTISTAVYYRSHEPTWGVGFALKTPARARRAPPGRRHHLRRRDELRGRLRTRVAAGDATRPDRPVSCRLTPRRPRLDRDRRAHGEEGKILKDARHTEDQPGQHGRGSPNPSSDLLPGGVWGGRPSRASSRDEFQQGRGVADDNVSQDRSCIVPPVAAQRRIGAPLPRRCSISKAGARTFFSPTYNLFAEGGGCAGEYSRERSRSAAGAKVAHAAVDVTDRGGSSEMIACMRVSTAFGRLDVAFNITPASTTAMNFNIGARRG